MKVIKIGAEWCSGCLVMRPRWQEVEENNPWLETEYYDFDRDEEAIKQYAVEPERLPVFIFLNDEGEEMLRLTGEVSVDKLEQVISEYRQN